MMPAEPFADAPRTLLFDSCTGVCKVKLPYEGYVNVTFENCTVTFDSPGGVFTARMRFLARPNVEFKSPHSVKYENGTWSSSHPPVETVRSEERRVGKEC